MRQECDSVVATSGRHPEILTPTTSTQISRSRRSPFFKRHQVVVSAASDDASSRNRAPGGMAPCHGLGTVAALTALLTAAKPGDSRDMMLGRNGIVRHLRSLIGRIHGPIHKRHV